MLQSISLNQQLTLGRQNLNQNAQFMNVCLVEFFRNNRTRTQQLPQFWRNAATLIPCIAFGVSLSFPLPQRYLKSATFRNVSFMLPFIRNAGTHMLYGFLHFVAPLRQFPRWIGCMLKKIKVKPLNAPNTHNPIHAALEAAIQGTHAE